MAGTAVAVAAWIGSEIIGPEVAARVVAGMRADGPRTAAKDVKVTTGIRPKSGYRRWYGSDATWNDLVDGRDQAAYERLIDTLAAARTRKPPTQQDQDEAAKLVDATIAGFMERQTAAKAIEIVAFRLGGQIGAVQAVRVKGFETTGPITSS